ncbi:hypothetical protein MESS4_530055 [Mesorhizobium sp. STM 4661]|nr:hypothetical protein MESS4_530055 [Mesorhizobium sp. STM 4661]
MHDDEFAVLRAPDVDLDDLGAHGDRAFHGRERVFRVKRLAGLHAAGAMRGHHHMVTPLVGVFEAIEDLPGAGFAGRGVAKGGGQRGGKQKALPNSPHRESLRSGSQPG